MTTIKRPRRNRERDIELKEYRRLVFLHAPALGSLLDQLDAGIIPEPLAVMIAISEGVEYLTNCSGVQGGPQACGEITSARFCSSC